MSISPRLTVLQVGRRLRSCNTAIAWSRPEVAVTTANGFPHPIGRRRLRTSTSTTGSCNLVASTRLWVESVVCGPEKLCPFAPPLLLPRKVEHANDDDNNDGLLRIVASSASNDEEAIDIVRAEAKELVGDQRIAATDDDNNRSSSSRHETTLIVFDPEKFPEGTSTFQDFVRLSWELQLQAVVDPGYGERLQLVLFHPSAVHDTYADYTSGTSDDDGVGGIGGDAADYTIRSPYPTVHLLREVDVMRAVKGGYPDLEGLPSRNKAKLRGIGIRECRKRLELCHQF